MSPVRSAQELLGPEGPFAAKFGAYEHRASQLEMAEAVERTLREERVLLCEAGTGTGKTLAYLVPVLLSNKRVVISTATKALQEQIAYKDLPLIARTLDLAPRVAVMKGLTNYVCRRRLAEFQMSEEAARPRYASALRVLNRWVGETETGETAELAGLSEDDPIWPQVTSSTDTRIGAGCAYHDECFVTRMRREAESAQLLIVNHHLFFADLALRGPHPASVLPDYDAVVFDEAHQIEDVAGLFFGSRVSRLKTSRLATELARMIGAVVPSSNAPQQLQQASDRFWEVVLRQHQDGGPRATVEPDAWRGPLQQAYFAIDLALEGVLGVLRSIEPSGDELAAARVRPAVLELLVRRTQTLRDQLANVVDGGAGMVTWLELSPPALSSTPVDLAPVLSDRVFASIPAVVLTSATLTTGDAAPSGPGSDVATPFHYFRRRFGVSDEVGAEELAVGSPFDFHRQAVLYTPNDLPPARSPAFLEKAADRVRELVAITGGGAFVLTTSHASMQRLYQLLKTRLPRQTVFVQGQAPKQALVAAFRASGDAVLVATQSFWEGVDVPGRALRLVVLEKLPFAVPTDPVVRARSLAIERSGGNPFMELFVPGAAIALKQGFGRLIRTRRDYGIVALLDERVHTKGYAKRLLRALPPVRTTDALTDVEAFWDRARALD